MTVVTAVQRPTPQTFVRVEAATTPEGVIMVPGYPGEFDVWNLRRRAWLTAHVGDYLNVTDARDVHPVPADRFDREYTVLVTAEHMTP